MASVKLEVATVGTERVYFDINDVLDIFVTGNKTYTIVFRDGEFWINTKMRKTVYDKFEKIKKKRGQVDNV
jgi:hypothetical protein